MKLLEQRAREPSKLPQLRGKALENARMENKQLREALQEREKKIDELEYELGNKEQDEEVEHQQMVRIPRNSKRRSCRR